MGKLVVSYVPQVMEEQMVRIWLYVHVCLFYTSISNAWYGARGHAGFIGR